MRKPINIIVLLAGVLSAGSLAPAAPEIQLITVDIGRAYNTFWKTKQNERKLQIDREAVQEEFEAMKKDWEAQVEQFNAKLNEVDSPILSKEAQQAAQAELEKMRATLEEQRQQSQVYLTNRENALRNRMQNQQAIVMGEIRQVILDLRKKKGANVVLDTGGPTGFGFSAVLFADPAFDITDEVIAELNKSMPAGFILEDAPAPAPGTPPARTTPGPAPAPAPGGN